MTKLSRSAIKNRSYKCLDNTICKSTFEALFINFLYINNIKYSYDKYISNLSRHRYDFLIADINNVDKYVEIWGMMGFDRYSDGRKIKEELYKEQNKILISVEYDVFYKSLEAINSFLVNLMIVNNIKLNNFSNEIDKLRKYERYDYKNMLKDLKQHCVDNNIEVFPTIQYWKDNGFEYQMNYFENNRISIADVAAEIDMSRKFVKRGFWKNENNWPDKINSGVKDDGYWENIDNVMAEVNPIIDEIGHFPPLNKLSEALYGGIVKHHGGVVKLANSLGYTVLLRKGDGYWKPKDAETEILRILITICKDLNKFPTPRAFETMKYKYIKRYFMTYPEQYLKIAVKLGYDKNTLKKVKNN
jgi:hypothetical protein